MSTKAPPLPTDLTVPILVTCLRLTRPRRMTDAASAATILNALPRTVAPDLSHTAIMLMPWIDTDVGCKLGDLWLLDALHGRLSRAPFMRAVQYTIPYVLRNAAVQGHVHVFDWWVENMGKPKWPLANVLIAACAHGHEDIVQWILANGNRDADVTGDVVRVASEFGRLDFLELFQAHGFDFDSCENKYAWISCAVLYGHDRLVSWWMQLIGSNTSEEEAKNTLESALVLANNEVNRRTILDMLLGSFLKYFTSEVASFACATGDLEFIEYCHARADGGVAHPVGYILASLFEHVHVMDWLHERGVLLSSVDNDGVNTFWWAWHVFAEQKGIALDDHVCGWELPREMSPYFMACFVGDCRILDWLHAHDVNKELGFAKALEAASRIGHHQVLEWFQAHRPDQIPSSDAVSIPRFPPVRSSCRHVVVWSQ